jgi:hypothetical protein
VKLPAELLDHFNMSKAAPSVEPAPAPPKPIGCPTCLESSVSPGVCYYCDGDGCAQCEDTGACPDCGIRR